MSYDFMMLSPRGDLRSMADIVPSNLEPQNGAAIKAELSTLFPAIAWEDKGDRGWLGRLTVDGEPYEFRVQAGDDECWNINTPEENWDTPLIAKICKALLVVAFDGQALELIDGQGRKSALPG
jgi:hypothetical protein